MQNPPCSGVGVCIVCLSRTISNWATASACCSHTLGSARIPSCVSVRNCRHRQRDESLYKTAAQAVNLICMGAAGRGLSMFWLHATPFRMVIGMVVAGSP